MQSFLSFFIESTKSKALRNELGRQEKTKYTRAEKRSLISYSSNPDGEGDESDDGWQTGNIDARDRRLKTAIKKTKTDTDFHVYRGISAHRGDSLNKTGSLEHPRFISTSRKPGEAIAHGKGEHDLGLRTPKGGVPNSSNPYGSAAKDKQGRYHVLKIKVPQGSSVAHDDTNDEKEVVLGAGSLKRTKTVFDKKENRFIHHVTYQERPNEPSKKKKP